MRTPIGQISLTDEQTRTMRETIQEFFLEERDEELGIVASQSILDFFMERLAPAVYNRALTDAEQWYRRMQQDMESDFGMLFKEK